MQAENSLQEVVNNYLEAFEARDLTRCLAFFNDDAVLYFTTGRFPGKKAIEQWHQDRFKGGMRIKEIEEVEIQDNTVVVHAVATSPKLKLVRIDDLRGTASFVINQGKFSEVRMGLRRGYTFHI